MTSASVYYINTTRGIASVHHCRRCAESGFSAGVFSCGASVTERNAHLQTMCKLIPLDSTGMTSNGCCFICYESSPPPLHTGCGCRSDNGLAHVACLVNRLPFKGRSRAVWVVPSLKLLPPLPASGDTTDLLFCLPKSSFGE